MRGSRRSFVLHASTAAIASVLLAQRRAQAQAATYAYDGAGRLKTATFPDGTVIEYNYDDSGNRTSVVTNLGPPPPPPPPPPNIIPIVGPGPVNLRSLADDAGYNGQNATYTFEVGSGATILGAAGASTFRDGNPGGVAIDSGAWPAGFTVALTLRVKTGGKVHGGGGAGGAGAGYDTAPGGTSNGGLGGLGGDAVYCSVGMSIEVESGGEIKAGGGGGGGGGGWYLWNSDDIYWIGGGGGGGFPNGAGGGGGGGGGSPGTISGGGVGAAGGSAPVGKTTGAGGAGGGAGAAGSNGAASTGTAGTYTKTFHGSGRAAGYAVRKNSHTVTVTGSGAIVGTVG